jgi:primosomal protein N' (replication factor Y)
VDADTGLFLPDFRAAERTFQLLAQVAGRAGRGPKGGRVIIQTRQPANYALTTAAKHDTEEFLRLELAQRADPPYPPLKALLNLMVSGEDEASVVDMATEVARWASALIAAQKLDVAVLGPARAVLARLKTRWRYNVLLRGDAEAIGRIVRYAATRLPRDAKTRVVMDRDPVSLL